MSPQHRCVEDLPETVIVDILSRLPVKTITQCKCVCKKWLNIVLDTYFADLQLSRLTVGFMIYHNRGLLKWVEVDGKLNHHNLHHHSVMSLHLNLAPTLKDARLLPVGSSVNGLVCLWQCGPKYDNTYICNPITREYMILPRPEYYRKRHSGTVIYCFGVGSLTRKYKVIRIFQKVLVFPDSTPKFQLGVSQAEVYTLGTGQWRSLGHVPYRFSEFNGQFLNGHAHWTIHDQDSHEKICSFNFDSETFELFPSPPSEATEVGQIYFRSWGVLKDCLCQSDTYLYKIRVWVMKEYGIKNSWHKELVIKTGICPIGFEVVLALTCHVESLKVGTILMATSANKLIVYCPRRKAIVKTESVDGTF